MIAKHILPKKEKTTRPQYDYMKLGEYIKDADHEGEKCMFAWHTGCYAKTYDAAVVEIMATQALNTRTRADKTYHLVVSFKPEDEPKLSPEVLQDIERIFAEALGFGEHQRVCGVHKNTNNLHLHIAYNKIHPEKLTITEPHRDYHKLAEARQAVEDKYDLFKTGRKPGQQIEQHAASMEAHTGEQAFQGYVLDRKEALLQAMISAQTWQDAHQALSRYGLGIKVRGNGLIVYNLDGKKNEAMKASALDRCLSKKKLFDHFGEYEAPGDMPPPTERYLRTPIQPRSMERDQLYEQYKTLMQERQSKLDASRQQSAQDMQAVLDWADTERMALDRRILPHSTKIKLRQIVNVKQRQAIENVREVGNAIVDPIFQTVI